MISLELLEKEWPHAPPALRKQFVECAPAIFERFGLNTPLRIAHFMGQITAETAGASIHGMRESLNYSPEGLIKTFGVGNSSAGVTPAEAKRIAHNERAIGARVYGPTKSPHLAHELGNTSDEDGYIFRGYGFLQTTGRDAWERYSALAGVQVSEPPEVFDVELSLVMSVAEFCQPRILRACDRDDVVTVSRIVNGGSNGLPERRHDTAEWERVITPEVAVNSFKASLAAAGVPVPRATYPEGTVKIGDKGPKVRAIQTRLKALNYNVGTIDDKFGDLTRKAVGAFQLDHSLPATGYVTPADREAMDEEGVDQPISPQRAFATVETVRADDSNPMKSTLDTVATAKKVAIGGGAAATVAKSASDATYTPDPTSVGDVLSKAGDHLDKVQSVSDQALQLWHTVEPFAMYLIPAAAVAVVFALLHWTETKALFAHRNLDAF